MCIRDSRQDRRHLCRRDHCPDPDQGILDTINLLPIVPGLLELLGVVVVGQWSWKNLTTSDKRNALVQRVQTLRKEYLG